MKHHALTDKARLLVLQIAVLDAELLETLNAIAEQQVFKAEGYDSMFRYCMECLGMSRDQAYRKLQAAKLMERYPTEVRELLVSGETNLTHLSTIASVVTNDNAQQMFEEVRGKSTREVERMLRREEPKPDVSEAVTRVAAPRKEGVELLAPDHWALRAMMDDATKEIYDDVIDLLTFEQRKPGKVLRLALVELRERLLIQKRRKRRSAAKMWVEEPASEQPTSDVREATSDSRRPISDVRKPMSDVREPETENREPKTNNHKSKSKIAARRSAANVGADIHGSDEIRGEYVGPKGATRYVPVDTARAVYERDNYRCQFVSDSGRKCNSTRDLQLHHLTPWARGGETTVENLKVYCRCHNLYQGELDFGPYPGARAA